MASVPAFFAIPIHNCMLEEAGVGCLVWRVGCQQRGRQAAGHFSVEHLKQAASGKKLASSLVRLLMHGSRLR
jgi:hypothetical protein